MELSGVVHNGVVVLEAGRSLPEGAHVTVSCEVPTGAAPKKRRVEFPLVRSKRPGSLHLTGKQIAEFLDEEDVPA